MKTFLLLLLGLCLVSPLAAQESADAVPIPARTPAELSELLGPIALYPDALVALILPASTAPLDIVLCTRQVTANRPLDELQAESWDPSVKALAHYPDTLRWLDENLEWTTQVGNAFIEQPVQVMETIQELRATARALGNLVDTPEQRIVLDDSAIRIIPTQPDSIYIPRYDPLVVYVQRPTTSPLLIFSTGYLVGSWLNYDWDWRRHRLYRGDWNKGWDYHRDRSRGDGDNDRYINNHLTNSQEWRPDPVRHRSQSRSAAATTSKDGSTAARARSLDPKDDEPGKRRSDIARPRPMTIPPSSREELPKMDRNGKIPASSPRGDGSVENATPTRSGKGVDDPPKQSAPPPTGKGAVTEGPRKPVPGPSEQETQKPRDARVQKTPPHLVQPERNQNPRNSPPPQAQREEAGKPPSQGERADPPRSTGRPEEKVNSGSRDGTNKSPDKKGGGEDRGESREKRKKDA